MLACHSFIDLWLMLAAGVLVDGVLGEPTRFHPLVGFGNLAHYIERWLNATARQIKPSHRIVGTIALAMAVIPWLAVSLLATNTPHSAYLHVLLLYLAIGHKSLHQHALRVHQALINQQLDAAKTAASWMVSRDAEAIEPVSATIESVLENGNDSVFGTLFWFLIAGGPGALAYRLVNTLDAMWGYKTPQFLYFGWAAARLDDAMNYIPARLTALTYAVLGKTRQAWQCWLAQAPTWKSPNAGPVMAAGAGALGIQLGGAARYHGVWVQRPPLGAGRPANAEDIRRALALVRHGVFLWLAITGIAMGII